MSNITVIVVDDDNIVREGIVHSIPWENYGFKVVGDANNGIKGLEMIEQLKPQLAIIDIEMQGMNGLDLSRTIRLRHPDTKVIILSGYASFQYAQQAIKEGVLEYLLKPVYFADFINILTKTRQIILEKENQKKLHQILTSSAEKGREAEIEDILLHLVSGLEAEAVAERVSAYRNLNQLSSPAIALIEIKSEINRPACVYVNYLRKAIGMYGHIFKIADGKIGILFSWRHKFILFKLLPALEKIKNIKAAVGVGKPVKKLIMIKSSYEQAYMSLKQRFYKGYGRVFFYKDDPVGNLKAYSEAGYDYMIEDKIYNIIVTASYENIDSAVDDFFSALMKTGSLDIRPVLNIVNTLYKNLEWRLIKSMTVNTHIKEECSFLDSLVKQDTLQDLKAFTITSIEKLIESCSGQKQPGNKLICHAMQYMKSDIRYCTLKSVSESLNITPNYLSSLFKAETGKTFMENLTQLRISKAQELLESLGYKTYEVAQMTGYSDTRYFSRIFKEYTGKLPSEYRKNKS